MAAIAPVRRGNTQRRPFSQRGVRRPPERIAFRRPLIVDKPSVCQRICPTACKSDDLRPAVGTGMHFYRKRKRLLCKKCQK